MGEVETRATDGAKRRRRRRPRRTGGRHPSVDVAGAGSSETSSAADGRRDATSASGRARKRTRAGGARRRSGSTTETATGGEGAAEVGTRKRPGRRRKPARADAKTRANVRAGTRAKKKGPTKREISAGGVVYRRSVDGIEVVLASRRTRRGQLAWGLAKGGIEDGESMEDAAVREVREETGLHARIEGSLGETRYFYVWEDVRIRKTVHFFLMRHTGGDIDDRDDEMEEIRWFPLDRALKRAAYRGERDVLGRAAELLR